MLKNICVLFLFVPIVSSADREEHIVFSDTGVMGERSSTRQPGSGLMMPNIRLNNILKMNGEQIYSVFYESDEFARRVIPLVNGERKKHLLLFGCSFTFGKGVNGDESLPYYLSLKLEDYRPYVYAVPGGGMNNMLYITRNVPLEKQVPEEEGLAIYYMRSEMHGKRAQNGIFSLIVVGDNPKFTWDMETKSYVYVGSFNETRSWLMSWLGEKFVDWQLAKYRWLRSLEWAPHPEFIGGMVVESAREYKRRFPKGRFIVVSLNSDKYIDHILKREGIENLKISLERIGAKQFIPYDGHLNAEGNQLLADEIYRGILNTLAPSSL